MGAFPIGPEGIPHQRPERRIGQEVPDPRAQPGRQGAVVQTADDPVPRVDLGLLQCLDRTCLAFRVVRLQQHVECLALLPGNDVHVVRRGRDAGRTVLELRWDVRHAAAYQPTFTLIDKRDGNGLIKPRPPSTQPLNQILYGPPGTGKTWHTVTRAVSIVDGRKVGEVAQEERTIVKRQFDEHREAGRIEMVTFTQNTTYEDFVEGIRPVLAGGAIPGAAKPAERGDVGGDVRYELSLGAFRHIVERAAQDPDERYVLVIDEINRGNIARIFGELITLIEDSKRIGGDDETRVTLPGSKTEFGVPANLYVVGTMNTADRSIALLDTALRRRFVFEEMMPDDSHPGVSADADGVDCRELLAAMNRRIAVLLDREHQIGHTYFLGVDRLPALASTFRTRIMPLLQEYFYDDWEKIRAVLNDNGFVQTSVPPEELVRSNLVDADRAVYNLLPPDDGRWTSPTAYRAVYETKVSAEDGTATPGA